jgi:pyruvate formate lyase activating enzyme
VSSGIVTHIQRFSVHDGPGIRTTVFLKGCQMHCPWCHNPETYRRQPEIQVFPDRCIGCGACVERCERGGHRLDPNGHVYRREVCIACGRCAETCFAKALVLVGELKTAEEVVAEVLADRAFYQPVGGVTVSGGEPLVQPEFTRAILELCRHEGIHTAVETNLGWPWTKIEPLVDLIDLFLVDIKLMDEAEHRALTGLSNRQTLDNLRQLDARNKPIMIRTPLMAGVNDSVEQIEAIADFLGTLHHVEQFDLLPYHPLGGGKYEALGLGRPPKFHTPTAAHLDLLAARAARPGFVVKVAGTSTEPAHNATLPDQLSSS